MRDPWRNSLPLDTVMLMEIEPKRTLADEWQEEGPEATLGARVRERRVERGWSQEDLAERFRDLGYNFHQTQIGKIESGSRPIRLNEAAVLALIFDVPLVELLEGPGGGRGDELDAAITDVSRQLAAMRSKQNAARERLSMLEAAINLARSELAEAEERRARLSAELAGLYLQRRLITSGNAKMITKSKFLISRDHHGEIRFWVTEGSGSLAVSTTQSLEEDALLAIEQLKNEIHLTRILDITLEEDAQTREDRETIASNGIYSTYTSPAEVAERHFQNSKSTSLLVVISTSYDIHSRISRYGDNNATFDFFLNGDPIFGGVKHATINETRLVVEKLIREIPFMPVDARVPPYESVPHIQTYTTPPGEHVTYQLREESGGRWGFVGRFGGPSEASISIVAQNFPSRDAALGEIKKRVSPFAPGDVSCEVDDDGNVFFPEESAEQEEDNE